MIDPRDGHIMWRFTWDDGTASIFEHEETTDEAPWADAVHIERVTHTRWVDQSAERLLMGRNDAGQDVVIDRVESAIRGDFDQHYDPETGTASVQAEYGDRTDLGDASAASPVERNQVQELVNRIRGWFHRDQQQDQGMGL